MTETSVRSEPMAVDIVERPQLFIDGAWVTPSGLPTWARVGIGILLETLFISYVVGFGRNAALRGVSGAMGDDSAVMSEQEALAAGISRRATSVPVT